MGILSVFVIAISLAMDAFGVSVANGMTAKRMSMNIALKFGAIFGFFQFIMPILGYWFGHTLNSFIFRFDSSWLSLVLLSVIGVKMIAASFKQGEDKNADSTQVIAGFKNLIVLGIATSVDALAVGITFAVEQVDVLQAAVIIGVVTLVLSAAGAFVGSRVQIFPPKYAERLAGVMLIGIGLNIFFG